TKWAVRVEGLSALRPTLERAIAIATSGLPGPVFVEVPIDLLYPESVVREWTLGEIKLKGPLGAFLRFYANAHLAKQFHSPHFPIEWPKLPHPSDLLGALSIERKIERVAKCLGRSNRPLFIVGGQALALETMPERTAKAIEQIGAPTYLAGMARGLLGKNSRIQFRHARGEAIRRADFVLICGLPLDFRLKYGQGIPRSATLVLVNLNGQVLYRNRIPDIAIRMHPGHFLQKLAQALPHPRPDWSEWLKELEVREKAREQEIEAMAAAEPTQNRVNPLRFLIELEKRIDDDSIVIADGGDFVATASYILRPRRPLSWLDPGVFGTLGVGGGFALGAALSRPGAEIWILWGDGSSAYSLSEYDTFVRHNLAPIGVVGTDAAWSQIARDQKEILGDPVGTILRDTDYERVAQGYGALGLRIEKESEIGAVLEEAKRLSKQGKPVCINVLLAPSDFRKGSISV
ncbi:MAG: thiamine pyrophosphate-dependent enzyme, partial [Deltaproteobacteria bacterium]|nr:thiamine pyrophosphate-dependent enzyme [Deltaproteobacteria bacterium]